MHAQHISVYVAPPPLLRCIMVIATAESYCIPIFASAESYFNLRHTLGMARPALTES